MLYSLVLVVFLSSGAEHRVPLINNLSDNYCIDLRDDTRGKLDYLNNLESKSEYDGDFVEFVDAECVAQGNFY